MRRQPHDGGNAAECTRACIRKGSKYALVVGDKVYTLDTSDKTALDQLDKLADKKAKVTGQANGDTITVLSVDGSQVGRQPCSARSVDFGTSGVLFS